MNPAHWARRAIGSRRAEHRHAARTAAAQAAFERDLAGGGDSPVGAGTADYLAAVEQFRRTVTGEMVAEFTPDVESHARV